MPIQLTKIQIDVALPKVERGLGQYQWLQSKAHGESSFDDPEFRRRYNHFYRVRRGSDWQDAFYGLMAKTKEHALGFDIVLAQLHQATGRYEASFASKLIATLDPSKPVIDSVVLKNLGMRLPLATSSDRAAKICEIHDQLARVFDALLATPEGQYLIKAFDQTYPNAGISDEKKLDLVLWQTRA